ncbi:DUF2750 domain-containing protein [Hyalangium minutum]|uniref:DUF2750 domain-containing protein n=1 Tax=Hyalangium minutum TaxID=394096 RepID=A0A085WEU9_9BACT|nr:DUF2750 domain-containing protein [Hyalangium minutum]KFE66212.1 hypothetical protein DB31_1277 [Hyalangium minutum]
MTQEISDARLQAVLELPPERRHAWFLQRVRESGEVWGLYAEGWALAFDDEGRDVLPLWPTPAAARLCATNLWEGFEPRSIPLQQLVDELLPDLAEEGIPVGVFFTPKGQGWPVTAAELREQLLGSSASA